MSMSIGSFTEQRTTVWAGRSKFAYNGWEAGTS